MIKSIQIFKAIAMIIEETTAISEIYSSSTEEGFNKECFFIEFINPTVSSIGESYITEDASVRISYFPIDTIGNPKKFKNLMDVKDILQEAFFKGFFVVEEEFYIPVDSLEFTITSNKVLEMLMQFKTVQAIEEEDLPIIENLNAAIKNEEV